MYVICCFGQTEGGIRDLVRSRGLGDVYKRQVIAFALDELKEDGAKLVLTEDLQQQLTGLAVQQDIALLQGNYVFAMTGDASFQQFVVGFAGVEQLDATHLQGIHRGNQAVSYTHLRAHETVLDLVCRLLLEKKNAYKAIHNNNIIRTNNKSQIRLNH